MTTRTLPQDWIHNADLEALSQAAASSPRLRAYRDVRSPSGPLGTVIALQPGAYVRPHTHRPAGAEAFEELIVLRGAIGVVLFDATSTPRTVLRAGSAGCPRSVRFPAGITHTAVALSPGTVVLETRDSGRPGPSNKHFAKHFPDEKDSGSRALVARWTNLCLDVSAGTAPMTGESRSPLPDDTPFSTAWMASEQARDLEGKAGPVRGTGKGKL